MLTAIGLCVLIMILQLVPEFRDGGWSRLAAPSLLGRAIASSPLGRLCARPGTRI